MATLWPAVGVIGARQVGKSTVVRNQLDIPYQLSMDDEDTLAEVEASAKVFVGRLRPPVLIDEAQKAPKLFDALKSRIDRKRIPGQFYLTGSSQFSTRLGIRESLTGRIGLLRLHPLTLAELHRKPFERLEVFPTEERPRFDIVDFSSGMENGGLPFPCFLRDSASISLYWNAWLETTVYRDIARFFARSYDPRVTLAILSKIKEAALQGECFSASMLPRIQSRRLNSYLSAMEEVFLIRRLVCHEKGVGKDLWILFDSGLLRHLLGSARSEGASLSLARTFLLNEISARSEYSGEKLELTYYKSAKGRAVDLVWKGIPIQVIATSSLRGLGWQQRALAGAMKTLGQSRGIIAAPIDRPILEKTGISILPWSTWS